MISLATKGKTVIITGAGGVIALTQSLAREFAQYDIRVNSVLPGHVLTPMWEHELEIMSTHCTFTSIFK